MSAHLDPPLTTIRVPSKQMGKEIADYIIGRLGGETPPSPAPIEAEMILRESTAPPPSKGDA
jgi:LacI family transcriptional regulator